MAPDPDADAAPAVAPSNNASAMPETPSETCIASLCNVSVSPNAEACLKDNSTCFCDSGWFTDVSARADLVNPYYCNRTVVEMVPGLWFALFSVLALMFAVLGYRSARKLVAIKTGCLDTPREKQIAAARRKVHGIKRRIEWTLVNRIHLYLIIWGFTQAVVCFLNDAYHSLAAKMALRLLQSVTWGIGSTSYLSVASFWYKVASFRCKQEVGRTNCIRRTFNGIQVCVWVAIFYNVMIDILKIAGALVDDTLARAAFNASLSLIFLTITLTIWVAYCQLRRQLTAGVNDMDEESRLDFAYKFNRLTRPVLVGSFWGVVAVCWGVLIAVMMLPARKHWTLVYYDPSFHTVAVFMPAFLEWFLYLALQNAVVSTISEQLQASMQASKEQHHQETTTRRMLRSCTVHEDDGVLWSPCRRRADDDDVYTDDGRLLHVGNIADICFPPPPPPANFVITHIRPFLCLFATPVCKGGYGGPQQAKVQAAGD